MNTLILIPARGGSKGIPGKNLKLLGGKPLIRHSIDIALKVASAADICVSTDDPRIADEARKAGLDVPFMRPAGLSGDTAGTLPVIGHALDHYASAGKKYENVLLLQPTSPFRVREHLEEILGMYRSDIDVILSAHESKANPYFTLYEEDPRGFAASSKPLPGLVRRQDAPKVYQLNGSLYVFNAASLAPHYAMERLERKILYKMSPAYSVDLDTPSDWIYAEYLIEKNLIPIS